MNFYIISGAIRDARVLRLTLDKSAQDDLTRLFDARAGEILRAEHTPFAAGYRQDEGEIVSLSQYELPGALVALTEAARATALPELGASDLTDGGMRAIVGVAWKGRGADRMAFQRIEARYLLKPEGFRILFADGRFVRDDRVGLQVADRVDAVYEAGALHILSWPRTHGILDLSAFMREATLAETETFLGHKKLSLAQGFDLQAVTDTWVRRKVASITDNKVLEQCSVNTLKTYAKAFDLEVEVRKGKIVVPAEKKAFKSVLSLLDEDLLSFGPTDEKWLVNSKRPARR